MEVTDRLDIVTQVTFQYDISSYCHSHRTLISAIHACMHACMHALPLSLSPCFSRALSFSHYSLQENNSHTAKSGSDELMTKGYGDHFSVTKGDGGRGGQAGTRAEANTFLPRQWRQTDLATLRSLKASWRAGDMPCLNHLT